MEDSEGELGVIVLVTDGFVKVLFNKPVSWFALGPEGAKQFAAALIIKAEQAERREKGN